MSSDEAREIEAYLAEWARRFETAKAKAAEVEHQHEFAQWQVRASDVLEKRAPEEILARPAGLESRSRFIEANAASSARLRGPSARCFFD